MRWVVLPLALLLGAASPQSQETPHCHVPGPFIVFFSQDSARLSWDAREVLDLVAGYIRGEGCVWPRIWLTGHTSAREHERSATSRIGAVRRYFVRHGLGKAVVGVQSFGPRQPRMRSNSAGAENQNRRVEIYFFDPGPP